MTTAWAHLPNAAHIDHIMADVKARPGVWVAAWDAARDAARDAAWDAARVAAWDAARDAAWVAAWDVARDAAWDAARVAARDAAWVAAWDAITAFVAWDDCAHFLDMEPDALRLLAAHDHYPAVLLLPACIALNTKEMV